VAQHRYRVGGLQVPAELDGVVLAVLGLDDRPQASPQIRRPSGIRAETTAAAAPTSYTPVQVSQAYAVPAGTDGTGHTIAIIELGGGFGSTDLDTYFSGLGITPPSVTAVGVDGASNVAGQDPQGADGEVLLDIEVAGAVAPGASQVVYFAPNTDQGFVDGVTTAVHASPTPTVVSISWGQSEDSWTAQARTALDQAFADAAALGVTVTVAAGDNGSADRGTDGQPHADFPASSPHALACGGTSLRLDPATGAIVSETVWNDGAGGGATGGGVSDVFVLPSWQASAGVPDIAGTSTAGRGVPDVAGNADPETGYQVLVDGKAQVVGGTSAVAPLWAALICRFAQATGQSFGLMQRLLYTGVTAGVPAPGFRSIETGNNGAYHAGPGWSPCTGLGVPDGPALLTRLQG
jgi:kumamolisin